MEDIRNYQEIILDIFRDVIKVCGDNGIEYFLIDGSCLGAIRHKGIIPWDDDIDIAIYADNYDKFYSTIRKSLGSHYRIEGNFDQRDYPTHTDVLGRICDTKHLVYTDFFNTDERNTVNPWIDVMLICGCPRGVILSKLHFIRILFLKALLKLSNRDSIGFNYKKKRGKIERIILFIARKMDFSTILNEAKISDALKRALLKYNPHKSDRLFAYSSDYREKEIVPYEYYGKGKKVEFEGMMVTVPVEAEKYLSQIYGDYNIIPSVDKRHIHVKRIIK